MEVIPKKISTNMPPMTIVYAKKRAFGPLLARELLWLGLHDVQNNGNSVFVIISNNSLVSISAISSNYSVAFSRILGWLVVWHQCLDLFWSAIPNLSSDCQIKVLTDLCGAVWTVLVALSLLESLFNVARGGLLEGSCWKTFLCVKKTCCALPSGTVLVYRLSIISAPSLFIRLFKYRLKRFR